MDENRELYDLISKRSGFTIENGVIISSPWNVYFKEIDLEKPVPESGSDEEETYDDLDPSSIVLPEGAMFLSIFNLHGGTAIVSNNGEEVLRVTENFYTYTIEKHSGDIVSHVNKISVDPTLEFDPNTSNISFAKDGVEGKFLGTIVDVSDINYMVNTCLWAEDDQKCLSGSHTVTAEIVAVDPNAEGYTVGKKQTFDIQFSVDDQVLITNLENEIKTAFGVTNPDYIEFYSDPGIEMDENHFFQPAQNATPYRYVKDGAEVPYYLVSIGRHNY